METLDTPLTRMKKKLEEKDLEIAALRVEKATLRGVNDLLKFELIQLETVLKGMQKSMDAVKEHVRVLKLNLPDIEQ